MKTTEERNFITTINLAELLAPLGYKYEHRTILVFPAGVTYFSASCMADLGAVGYILLAPTN